MNIIILAGITLMVYYLLRSQRPTQEEVLLLPVAETDGQVDAMPTIELSTTTPVPISTEAGLGKTRYTFNVSIRWSNLNPVTDIINFQIGRDLLASIHPRASSGSQLVPVTVNAMPGGARRLVAVVKNIAGLEYDKAAAYADIAFGTWV